MKSPYLDFEVEDEWFLAHHFANLSPEFCSWWVGHYGSLNAFEEGDIGVQNGDEEEYYVRMAFALMGWNARAESMGKPDPEKRLVDKNTIPKVAWGYLQCYDW